MTLKVLGPDTQASVIELTIKGAHTNDPLRVLSLTPDQAQDLEYLLKCMREAIK